VLYPNAAAGTFDIRVAVPNWGERRVDWHAIEVKYGETRIPFSDIDDDKRNWSDDHQDDYHMWLWLCMGKRIRHRKYPRVTYLIPLELFYDIENALDRKSIPYGMSELEPYGLAWLGGGVWEVSL
jgi:hypothetical protein